VTGSFGWVDPNGVFRLTDYVSDAGGYRIEKEQLFKVERPFIALATYKFDNS
jgi:hypothetical protein